ncbi:hypothetical protein GCM10027446_12130 [Angustibacter peucedani]
MSNREIPEIPLAGHRLGRHVNHDPRSRAYAHFARERTLESVRHHRHAPVLDQGDLGSCTGNAMVGAAACDPLFAGLPQRTTLDEDLAVRLYSAATSLDDYAGTYPPTDTGSDGLSVAKAAKAAGLISGYRHAFTLEDALDALQDGPVLTGIDWYAGFDEPAADGTVTISGAIRGGHEIVVDEYDAATGRIGLTNSWGRGWGVDGRFYMTTSTWAQLLAQDGDVTVLVPATAPPPEPDPDPIPDTATFLDADPVLAGHVVRAAARRGMTVDAWLTQRLRRYFSL